MTYLYYIIEGGAQCGPFPAYELPAHGLNPESYVWREGLAEWTRAALLPELAPLFQQPREDDYGLNDPINQEPQHTTPPPYGQPNGTQQPYGQQPYGQQPYGQPYGQHPEGMQPVPHTNWLPWAIVVLVVGFFTSCIGGIFGIIATVKAGKANDAYARGDYYTGNMENSSARTLVIIGGVLAALGIAGNLFLLNRLPSISSLLG